ncbi:MAG: ABC-2 transporter permease [Oscillospiraceae bacterium]|nr:ABC-2 transporter permease [Oscillospiraceae bacterium]
MKGLLIKDLLVLKRYGRTLGFLVLFYGVFSMLGNSTAALVSMITVVLAMTVVTSFAYDEQARWDRYVCALPVKREQVVAAKYLLGLLLVGAGLLISLLLGVLGTLLRPQAEGREILLPAMLGNFIIVLLLLALTLPLIYRFGVKKSRILFLVAMALIGGAVAASASILSDGTALEFLQQGRWNVLLLIAPVAALLAYALSYRVSCRIYAKKEL